MNWEAISGIAEIVGAATIVVSLLYVAVQVKHSSKMIEHNNQLAIGNTWHTQCALYNEVFTQLASDSELSDIYDRALSGEQLVGSEAVRFSAFVNTFLAYAEDTHVQTKSGLVSEQLQGGSALNMYLPYIQKLLSAECARKWWDEDGRNLYSVDFYQAVNERLEGTG